MRNSQILKLGGIPNVFHKLYANRNHLPFNFINLLTTRSYPRWKQSCDSGNPTVALVPRKNLEESSGGIICKGLRRIVRRNLKRNSQDETLRKYLSKSWLNLWQIFESISGISPVGFCARNILTNPWRIFRKNND